MTDQGTLHRLSRRDLLRLGFRTMASYRAAAAFGCLGTINALAQSGSDYKALVCVFLFGGNDANNTIVPTAPGSYAAYQSARPSIAIPQSMLLPITPSGGSYGLHPSLAAIHPLYAAARQLAIVANVGMLVRPLTRAGYLDRTAEVPSNLFSHADQQRQWQSGVPGNASTSGWSGRLADRMQSFAGPSALPMAIGVSLNTLQLIGQSTQPTWIKGSLKLEGSDLSPYAAARDAAMQELLTLSSGATLVQAANRSMRDALDVVRLIDEASNAATPLATPFPATALGGQMQQIAKLIQLRNALGARRQIFFCSLDGFDTHSYQGATHASLLKSLADALAAFQIAMDELAVRDRVTAFTESEFGRTLQVNSNLGTDHAWGGHQFVLGGMVRGGAIYGQFPALELQGPDDCGHRGSWLPTTSLDQYGATLATWFGVGSSDLPSVFPNIVNFSSPTLGFL